MKDHYDAVVIGGGPAGSTAAAIVADAGFSTLQVEREKMPRFHVGESLMPETYWILQRLGVLQQMQQSAFVKKVSVQFISHDGKVSQPFFFNKHDPRECSQTWQVERAEFDQLLFKNAIDKGVEGLDQTRVLDVMFDGIRACGVRLVSTDRKPREVSARVVVDATGQQALLANRLKLRKDHPHLRKAAIWSYFQGAHRDSGEHGGGTIILHSEDKNTWFWFIPLSQDIVSIGVVGDNDFLLSKSRRDKTPSGVFQEELHKCPRLAERMGSARTVSHYHVAKEFSYQTSQHAGDGWVLVGDAWGFIDPIYSSGVFFAMKSAEMAADAIVEGLRSDNTSAAQLGSWTDEFNAATQWIRKLVQAFYTNEFSFGQFIREHPQHQANLTDLLIGRIFYDGAGRIFDDMYPQG